MAALNFDVFNLIDLVRERPAIWDRTSDLYKDRRHTKLAWREVCVALVPGYENYNDNEQFEIGKHLLGKWTNLRDNFIKSNKKIKQSMQSSLGINKKRRKYIFYDQLSFMEKILDDNHRLDLNPSPTPDEPKRAPSTIKLSTTHEYNNSSDWEPTETSSFAKQTSPPTKKRKITTNNNNNNTNTHSSPSNSLAESILEVLENHGEPDPDQSFFNSILPLVQNFCEDEKLEFRMEVLKLIKSMKAGRRRIQ